MKKYNLVVCGGTFDLFHKGHESFIKEVLDLSDKMVLGLTSDKYILEHKPNKSIASFEARKKELVDFLKEIKAEKRVEIIKIDDMYGPLLDPSFKADALAVASENYESAIKINRERKKEGLSEIEIVGIPVIRAEDGKIISATRIREGFVDKKGKLLLPEYLREKLKEPFGELMADIPQDINKSNTITVGDITTKKFLDKNLNPILAVVDFKVKREPIDHTEFKNVKTINVINPPGVITHELLEAVENSFKNSDKKVIIVDGEEDLAVLPVIIYSPLGFEIFYGQPNEGLVKVKVTNKIKDEARKLLELFEKE